VRARIKLVLHQLLTLLDVLEAVRRNVFVTTLRATVELVGCTRLVYGCFSDDAVLSEVFCPRGLYAHLLHLRSTVRCLKHRTTLLRELFPERVVCPALLTYTLHPVALIPHGMIKPSLNHQKVYYGM